MSTQELGSGNVDRRLLLRLRIYLAIFVIASVLVVVDLVRLGTEGVVPVLLCVVGGTIIGVVASRMSRLSWDRTSAAVVGRIDAVGAVILVAYVLLVIFRGKLLAQWFRPEVVGAAGVATLAGLMLGQLLGTAGGIARMLHVVKARSVTPPAG